jgi:Stage II sporulation protein E (SpoIIE)
MPRFVTFPLQVGLALVCVVTALAQQSPPAPNKNAAVITPSQSVVALNGPWKFHVGDSPIDPATNRFAWAEPGFDDSGWEALDLTPQPGGADPFNGDPRYVPGWTSKGHPRYMGWAWYRLRILVGTPKERLALEGPFWMEDGYQAFANGTLLGSFGRFRGQGKRPVCYFTQPRMFVLPAAQGSGPAPAAITVAFRVWMGRPGLLHFPDAGGLHYAPLLGGAKAIRAQYLLDWHENIIENSWSPFEGAVLFLLGLLAATLMLIDRADDVYAWLAAVLFFSAGFDLLVNAGSSWTQWVSGRAYLLFFQGIFLPLHMGLWMMVWWKWFRLRRPSWVPWAIGGLTAVYMIFGILAEGVLPGGASRPLGMAFVAGPGVTRLVFLALLVFIIWLGIREDGPSGWLVLPAVVPLAGLQFQTELVVLHMPVQWHPLGINFTIGNLANLVLEAALSVLLLQRLLRSLERQRRMALDVKQAQEVQRVILPQTQTTVPGLVIESEYRPALEVGGDYFQILPDAADGSVLIVAGDVTGKGLKAGMLVALLVGAIRMAAETITDPVQMLEALNRRLLGRADAQSTCLALRIEKDGSAMLANAGHMAPYLNGEPLEMEGALPLGVLEGTEFSVMRFHLNERDRLVLISDGIVEATDAEGKMFGYERIHELLKTGNTAAAVADAAQRFGQNDDISVISATRFGELRPALA